MCTSLTPSHVRLWCTGSLHDEASLAQARAALRYFPSSPSPGSAASALLGADAAQRVTLPGPSMTPAPLGLRGVTLEQLNELD